MLLSVAHRVRVRAVARRAGCRAGTCAPISFLRAPCATAKADFGTVGQSSLCFERWMSCSHRSYQTRLCNFFFFESWKHCEDVELRRLGPCPTPCSTSSQGSSLAWCTFCRRGGPSNYAKRIIATIMFQNIARHSRSAPYLVVPVSGLAPTLHLCPLPLLPRLWDVSISLMLLFDLVA